MSGDMKKFKSEAEERFEKKQQAKAFHIPTDDNNVQLLLRTLKQPAVGYGEKPIDRRERLRLLIEERGDEAVQILSLIKLEEPQIAKNVDSLFSHSSNEFSSVRRSLVDYSLQKANERLEQERRIKGIPTGTLTASRQREYSKYAAIIGHASQFVSNRPASFCEFIGNSILTGHWDGQVSLWNGALEKLRSWTVSTGKVCGLACRGEQFATCDDFGQIKLFSVDNPDCTAEVASCKERVSRIRFHPNQLLLGSAGNDKTVKLFDVEKCQELARFVGHSQAVHSIAFHPDGGLMASGSKDALCRVWDLRSGANIWTLHGHASSVLAVDCKGYCIATGSEDDTIRIWDLRKLSNVATLLGHTSSIIHLKFTEHALLSCSFDKSAKVWGGFDYRLLNTLESTDKIMCIDENNYTIATVGFDRTLKIWK